MTRSPNLVELVVGAVAAAAGWVRQPKPVIGLVITKIAAAALHALAAIGQVAASRAGTFLVARRSNKYLAV
jgi:hypothetical protein